LRFRPPEAAGASEQGRNAQTDSTEVWVIGAAGAPEARRIKIGVTDGVTTEMLDGALQPGDRVILGVQRS
jgi:multidrug efflux pump subunit AcrA (membrane-fusion protein)